MLEYSLGIGHKQFPVEKKWHQRCFLGKMNFIIAIKKLDSFRSFNEVFTAKKENNSNFFELMLNWIK